MTTRTARSRRTPLVVGALLAGLLSALLVGPTAANATTSAHRPAPKAHRETTTQSIANSLLAMLNKERKSHDLAPLSMNADLIESAHTHNLWMARTNVMSHQEKGEPDLATRITRTGYRWSWAGENIGWNSEMTRSGVLQLESMMYHEKPPNDGHRLNILSTHFKNIGVDVYMDKVNHKVWLTTDFGRH